MMGFSGRCCVVLSVLCVCGGPGVWGQDLRERDALCSEEGCFAVYFQRKNFLDSWRSCKEKGGNLATVKRPEEAALIRELFTGVELRDQRNSVRVWIGLQRQPRQCSTTRPLRGFTWITGDQDTQYTNWFREDTPSTCSATRCVAMSYSTSAHDQHDNFKWLDGSCALPVDAFLCRYTYKGMCPVIPGEGGGPALYTTPFNLISTLLTNVPFGSVATVPCPDGTRGDQAVLCTHREDGTIGWSKDTPLCSDTPDSWCDHNNGGCEHYCLSTDGHYYCECSEGYLLADDGQSCIPTDSCQGAPCEFECEPTPSGYRCTCPEGYLLAPDGQDCLDVDECLQQPCPHECANAPGTFQCHCGEGYQPSEGDGGDAGDAGYECEDTDECMDAPCEHACENTPGSFTCHCHLGFSPSPEDPTRCQDTDECQIPGTCEQMCVNYVGGFECHCEEGYELQPDHYSCSLISDHQSLPGTVPSYPGLSWNSQDQRFPWLDELPDWGTDPTPLAWLTDPPSLEWLPTDLRWFTDNSEEESSPTLLPGWAGPDWIEPFLPAFTPSPSTTPAPDWLEDESTPTPAPDWLEDESTPTPAPDWLEDESTPTPAPDWQEDESTPTPAPDWPEDERTPTPASDWIEDESTPTVEPDWLEDESTPTPAPDWLEDESTPTPTPDWLEDESTSPSMSDWSDVENEPGGLVPSASTPAGGAWQWLWPSSTPAAPEESVGGGRMVSHGLDPDGESEYEFGAGESDPSAHNDSPMLPDSRSPTAEESIPENRYMEEEGSFSSPEWYTPPPLPLTPISPVTPVPGVSGGAPERGSGQRQDRSWLVVALLVPLSIFVVVMVALGIVYCTRCAVQPRSKSVTDCYRWVTSSKTASPAATTAKSRV